MSGLIKVVRKAKPFFSRVDEAAKELPRTKGTGKEFMAELKKQPGVKKAELDDRKLSELESAPKMTKEEFIQKLEQKPAPKIDESIKAHPTDVDLDDMAMKLIDDKADELTERKLGKRDRFNRYDWDDYKEGAIQYLKDYDYDKYLREAKRNIEENVGADFPKFTDPMLRLPGGENYREILLKLPSNRPSLKNMSRAEYNAAIDAADKAGIQNYQSQHWDEPNVLAHIRVQDRVGPNGEKILHVEEIQSDWHQKGRKEGYGQLTHAENIERVKLRLKMDEEDGLLTDDMNRLRELEQKKSKVPDAPFKKNWHELATKRIMDYAIQNGYDKVAITPGVEHVKRYEDATRKVVDEIAYNPSTGYFTAIKDGKVVQNQKMDPETLEKTVGGETARNLLASEPNNIGVVSMKSQDMTIGGELYKNLYDRDVVNFINKEYGKYGANVGRHDIPVPPKNSMDVQEYTLGPEYISGQATWDELLKANPRLAKEYAVPLHSIDITPEMRETIQSKGQPLYQATGIGLTGAAAAPSEEKVQISDNPDTMMLELQDQGFAGGGLLKKAAKAIKGTQEALPAAEREANLQRMLAESKAPMRLYHGTTTTEGGKGQEAIRRIKPSKEGSLGSGVYLTPSAAHASAYSGSPNDEAIAAMLGNKYHADTGLQFLRNQQTGNVLPGQEGGNMLPVYAQIKNPLVLEGKGDPMIEALTKLGMDEDKAARMVERAYENRGYIGKEVETRARAAGYDGLMQYRDGDLSEVVSYNPNAVKSAIGNQGTYDITDPDLNKAVGGLARAKRK